MRMKRGWPERWQAPGAWTLVLRPLSWLYRGLSALLWAWRRRRAPFGVAGLTVISVGNLSVGGTGKSALVRAVALRALARKRRTAVLLRGYGAAAGPRPLWVSKGGRALVGAAFSGDEAQEHARVKGLGVLVDADRLRGAREARAQGFEVLILDDGFQRRWQLARHSDLLLAAWPEIERGERLLPWGPWRETWASAEQADALLLQDAPNALRLPAPWDALPLIRVGYRPRRLLAWKGGALGAASALARLKGKRVLALSGLGTPGRFEAGLQGLGAKVIPARFADHHPFSPSELAGLRTAGCSAIVTTVKDAMRLPADWEPTLPVWVLEADLESRPAKDLNLLLERILG